MAAEENKAVVRRFVEVSNGQHSLDVLDELCSPDFVNHDPSNPAVRDLEGLKESWKMLGAGFPDMQTTIDELLTDGDCVIKRFTARGTQTGEFNGIPPTGRSITLQGIDIHRLENGRIKEIYWGYDNLGMLQQLGVIPQPEQAAV
jgi:steroid delta-isomerase-like uncharacterized protein